MAEDVKLATVNKQVKPEEAGICGIEVAAKRGRGTSGWGYVTIVSYMISQKWSLQVESVVVSEIQGIKRHTR